MCMRIAGYMRQLAASQEKHIRGPVATRTSPCRVSMALTAP
jgi:hypothetical protein